MKKVLPLPCGRPESSIASMNCSSLVPLNCLNDHSRNPPGRGMTSPRATVAMRPLTPPERLTSVKRG